MLKYKLSLGVFLFMFHNERMASDMAQCLLNQTIKTYDHGWLHSMKTMTVLGVLCEGLCTPTQ